MNVSKIESVGLFGQLSSNANLNVVSRENGSVSAGLLTKKQYGERHNLKGSALNQAHYDYKRQIMGENAKMVGAALLTGELGLTRIAANAKRDGGTVSFKLMSALKEPKQKAVDLSKAITEDNAADAIEHLRKLGYNVQVAPVTA